jgi:crotonobetainyl-CoA:carnitine CoA-transferase CaiB-like acyl-CoA transferase
VSRGPLAGLRVVEFAGEQAEWAGKLMADMGADVVKVEPPGGATTRRIGPFAGDVPHPERSLHFWHYNTSKRSLVLDLDRPEGRAAWLRLAASADVVIETTAPGTLDALGIGYAALATANPGLVMASVTPWGQSGPYVGFASSDLVQMAMGGIVNSCGYDDHDLPPVRPGLNQSYQLASHHALIGILTALYARPAIGRGQHVDVAIHDCVSLCTEFAATHWFYAGAFVNRQTGRHASPRETARTQHPAAGGGFVNFGQTHNDRVWGRFLEWADEAGLGDLLRQFGDAEDRLARASEVMDCIHAVMATLGAEEVWHEGQKMGLPWGAVRRPEDWLDDPHAAARGFFHEVFEPELGCTLKHAGPPAAFTEHPGEVRRAPRLGEHTAEVLLELGYSEADMSALRATAAF